VYKRQTRKIALVNILAGQTDLVPEFVPWYGDNSDVAGCAVDLLDNPQKLQDQRARLASLIATLDRPGASLNAAKIALELIDGKMT
jgi:lipid A disaccharide synthetase